MEGNYRSKLLEAIQAESAFLDCKELVKKDEKFTKLLLQVSCTINEKNHINYLITYPALCDGRN